jgi:hypothetical protein
VSVSQRVLLQAGGNREFDSGKSSFLLFFSSFY